MKTRLSVAALYGVLCVCGCTSYRDVMKDYMRQSAEAIAAAKANPLPPLPDYPEDAQSAYDTSARLMVIGRDDARGALAAALEKAGCRVLDKSDTQTVEFHTPDLVLCPSWAHCVVHGDGASWCQVRLIVSTRSSVRLDRTGAVEQMAVPRIFQTYARVKMPDSTAAQQVPDSPAAYAGQVAADQAKAKQLGQEGLKIAIDKLMRIDAFRREIAKKRNP